MTDAADAIAAIERLRIPQGPLTGQTVKLAGFQRDFIEGALDPANSVACLSVGRGNGKTMLAAGLSITHLLGEWGAQAQREILLAARTRDQAKIAFAFARSFGEAMPGEIRDRLTFRASPVLEIQFDAEDGPHVLKAVSSSGKAALGGSATFAVMDERAAWAAGRGEELEAAVLTSLGKRGGKAIIISTSAPSDTNPFSIWLDRPPQGCFVHEHRPMANLPADDLDSLLIANPGCIEGIGADKNWLLAQARQAIQRGGSALSSFRNLHRNERVSTESRSVLVELDDWLLCETDTLPARDGDVVVGLDFGSSMSMSAASYFWPATGRLECKAWYPTQPDLLTRGTNDSVADRYQQMHERGELHMLGKRTVPAGPWIREVVQQVEGQTIAAIVGDRFKQSEIIEGLETAGVRAPIIWRGMGWRDGSEDVERFRKAVADKVVQVEENLLLRSALSDSVTLVDPAGNAKLVKGRSFGRIDAAAACVVGVAEGMRMRARPVREARIPQWV